MHHKRRRSGGTSPQQKIGNKYFSGNYYMYCQIRAFSGKNRVKFGHFVNCSYIFSGKNVLPPKVDWAPTPMVCMTCHKIFEIVLFHAVWRRQWRHFLSPCVTSAGFRDRGAWGESEGVMLGLWGMLGAPGVVDCNMSRRSSLFHAGQTAERRATPTAIILLQSYLYTYTRVSASLSFRAPVYL